MPHRAARAIRLRRAIDQMCKPRRQIVARSRFGVAENHLSCFGQQIQGAVQLQRCFGRFAERGVVRAEERNGEVGADRANAARYRARTANARHPTRLRGARCRELAQRANSRERHTRAGRATWQFGTGRARHGARDRTWRHVGVGVEQHRQQPLGQRVTSGIIEFERLGVENSPCASENTIPRRSRKNARAG